MGKGTIVESLGEGLYLVDVDLGVTIKAERIALMDGAILRLDDQIIALEENENIAAAEAAVTVAALNAAIDAFALAEYAPDSDEYRAVIDAQKENSSAQNTYREAKARHSATKAVRAGMQVERDELEAFEALSRQECWCVDYTTDAIVAAEVALLPVPGETQITVIAPQAPIYELTYGQIVARELQTAHQVLLNAAILPGWQRFYPIYRVAIVLLINDDNTVNVELEGISSAQNLPIGPLESVNGAPDQELHNVPVDYMGAGGDIFVINDRVIVRINNFDWADCTVIGFETDPRPVAGLLAIPGDQYRIRVRDFNDEISWAASEIGTPAVIGETVGLRGYTNGKLAVSWINNLAEHRVELYFRQQLLIDFNDGFDSQYYITSSTEWRRPMIFGAVALGKFIFVQLQVARRQPSSSLVLNFIDYWRFEWAVDEAGVISVIDQTYIGASSTTPTSYTSGGSIQPVISTSISPSGRKWVTTTPRQAIVMTLYDTGAWGFDFVDHPSPSAWETVPTYSGDDDEELSLVTTCNGVWYFGCEWDVSPEGVESISWITYTASVNSVWESVRIDDPFSPDFTWDYTNSGAGSGVLSGSFGEITLFNTTATGSGSARLPAAHYSLNGTAAHEETQLYHSQISRGLIVSARVEQSRAGGASTTISESTTVEATDGFSESSPDLPVPVVLDDMVGIGVFIDRVAPAGNQTATGDDPFYWPPFFFLERRVFEEIAGSDRSLWYYSSMDFAIGADATTAYSAAIKNQAVCTVMAGATNIWHFTNGDDPVDFPGGDFSPVVPY